MRIIVAAMVLLPKGEAILGCKERDTTTLGVEKRGVLVTLCQMRVDRRGDYFQRPLSIRTNASWHG
jgi:hypothetical protein